MTYAVEIGLSENDPRLQWGMTTVVTFEGNQTSAALRGYTQDRSVVSP